jgi:TetR/AcrR family acrAB operon transcriptional repressor
VEALETREQLLDAAEQVFRQRGVGHASLAEVADAAGVTRGAVYHHFASKAELFEAMLARAEMPLDAAFDVTQEPVADPLGAVRETALKALMHLTSCVRVRNIFEVAFLRCEYTDELAAAERRHLHDRAQCLAYSAALLDQAVACRQLPKDTDTHVASFLLHAVIGGLMRDWVQSPDEFDLAAAAPQAVDLFLAGLRAAPPRRPAAPRARARRTAKVAGAVAARAAPGRLKS